MSGAAAFYDPLMSLLRDMFTPFVLVLLAASVSAGAAWGIWWRAGRSGGGAALRPKALLNRPEGRLFRMIEHRLPKGYRLHAQVSYGEMFMREETAAYFAINAARADMVITDRAFNVIAVIEYQGAGHAGFSPRAALQSRRRDTRKRQTLNAAGITLVEMPGEISAASVARALEAIWPDQISLSRLSSQRSSQRSPDIRRPAR